MLFTLLSRLLHLTCPLILFLLQKATVLLQKVLLLLPTRAYLVIAYKVWRCLRWTTGIKKHHWKDLHELVPKVIKCINHIPHDFLSLVTCFTSHSSMKITTKVVIGITLNVTVVSISPIGLHWWDSGLGLWTVCSKDLIFFHFYVKCLQACEFYRIIHNNNNNLKFISSASFTTFPISYYKGIL